MASQLDIRSILCLLDYVIYHFMSKVCGDLKKKLCVVTNAIMCSFQYSTRGLFSMFKSELLLVLLTKICFQCLSLRFLKYRLLCFNFNFNFKTSMYTELIIILGIHHVFLNFVTASAT